MERVLIGLLVLGFMSVTILVSAWLAVRGPRSPRHASEPTPSGRALRSGAESGDLPGLVDSVLPSALD